MEELKNSVTKCVKCYKKPMVSLLLKNKTKSVYEWYEFFQDDREEVEDDEPGRPSTSIIDENVKKVKKRLRMIAESQ
jgi:hypothetical protein